MTFVQTVALFGRWYYRRGGGSFVWNSTFAQRVEKRGVRRGRFGGS